MKKLTKITSRIWHPVLDKFEARMEARCLRRDLYLNRVLDIELDRLSVEVSIPNSEAAEKFVQERLSQLDRKMVSLAIDATLADRLAAICSAKRIVRDAFLNRIFLLLAASPGAIDRLFFATVADEWKRDLWNQDKNSWLDYFSGAFYPLEQDINPFWGIREALDMYSVDMGLKDHTLPDGRVVEVHEDLGGISPRLSVYTTLFTNKDLKTVAPNKDLKAVDLYGMNTYIADWQIPDHPSELAYRQSLDDLL